MSAKKSHYWAGIELDDEELGRRLPTLADWARSAVCGTLEVADLLRACEAYSRTLLEKQGNHKTLVAALTAGGGMTASEAEAQIAEMAAFLSRGNLEQKLKFELGSVHPFTLTRRLFTENIFEAWAPLGFLVHIAPANASSVAPLSVVEGLLAGNVNFLKTSASEGDFPVEFLRGLFACDRTGTLANFVIATRFSSSKKDWLERIFAAADGISVWGGEEAVQSVRALAPSTARVIDWGHKISFAYLGAGSWKDKSVLEAVSREICLFEQQACSSPQCLYLETESWVEVEAFAGRLALVLERVSKSMPRIEPSAEEQGELSLVTELAREESCFGNAKVIEAKDKSWRILADERSALVASPLYRSIWIKPLPRAKIVETLRPMRAYLQTAGLSCALGDLGELSDLLLKAGTVRIRKLGEMPGSYPGEAHDGVYALQRYCKRVSLQAGPEATGISSFSDLRFQPEPVWKKKPAIMGKAEFQNREVAQEFAHLYFKSGGSSGEPKMSVFTYEDYHEQMAIGAEGLYAAGLDPLTDRNMNLFFSGSLYGGFLSIFSVLEKLEAVQFPMAAVMDFPAVADAIIRNRVTVLLGMPSYIVQLFETCKAELGKYRGIRKIFYGGEHFNDAQRRFLREGFGVETIKSVGYGSVDTGPLGYQCQHCEGGVHHLHQRLQYLEILDLEEDRAVTGTDIGRLVFTSRMRRGQSLDRYELGDVGHWVPGACSCGRASPRFKLLGRSGDVIRVGSSFLNYQKFVQILSERLGYAGALQLELSHDGLKERVLVRLAEEKRGELAQAREVLLSDYDDLREIVAVEGLLKLDIEFLPGEKFERTRASGKLVRVSDRRER